MPRTPRYIVVFSLLAETKALAVNYLVSRYDYVHTTYQQWSEEWDAATEALFASSSDFVFSDVPLDVCEDGAFYCDGDTLHMYVEPLFMNEQAMTDEEVELIRRHRVDAYPLLIHSGDNALYRQIDDVMIWWRFNFDEVCEPGGRLCSAHQQQPLQPQQEEVLLGF